MTPSKAETPAGNGGHDQDVNQVDYSASWAMVPRSAARMHLSASALRVFISMSSHADGRTRKTWVTQATIAAECGWIYGDRPDTGKVHRAQRKLRDAGLIRRTDERKMWPSGHWSNIYRVAPFPVTASSAVTAPRAPADTAEVASRVTATSAPPDTAKGAVVSKHLSDPLKQTPSSRPRKKRDSRAELKRFESRYPLFFSPRAVCARTRPRIGANVQVGVPFSPSVNGEAEYPGRSPIPARRDPRPPSGISRDGPKLFELGPTPFPAYAGTDAGLRSLTDLYLEAV